MKLQFHNITKKWVAISLSAIMAFIMTTNVGALGLTMSPMSQKMILNPGETYKGSITIASPDSNESDVEYEMSIEPFYYNEDSEVIFEANGDSGVMANWITIDSGQTGKLSPNQHNEVVFSIDVPKDAPAGGQYVSLIATTKNTDEQNAGSGNSDAGDKKSAMFEQKARIGHLIYAEVTGSTLRQGEIQSIDVPSFLLSGDLKGISVVKNTGNVHGTAKYTMQVYPLFSSEEIFTNEQDPQTKLVLPDRSFYSETVWDKTPGVGIFNVVYTVEFEGITSQVSKMVIICPVWLLFLIIFVIVALIIWIVMKVRSRGKKNARRDSTTSE